MHSTKADLLQTVVCMQIFAASGAELPGFSGVPVFQASGLTIKTKKGRYSPVFLDYRDLEVAIEHAFRSGMLAKGNLNKANAKRAQDELDRAADKVFLTAIFCTCVLCSSLIAVIFIHSFIHLQRMLDRLSRPS